MKRILYGGKLSEASMEKNHLTGTWLVILVIALNALGFVSQEFGGRWSPCPLSNLVMAQEFPSGQMGGLIIFQTFVIAVTSSQTWNLSRDLQLYFHPFPLQPKSATVYISFFNDSFVRLQIPLYSTAKVLRKKPRLMRG